MRTLKRIKAWRLNPHKENCCLDRTGEEGFLCRVLFTGGRVDRRLGLRRRKKGKHVQGS